MKNKLMISAGLVLTCLLSACSNKTVEAGTKKEITPNNFVIEPAKSKEETIKKEANVLPKKIEIKRNSRYENMILIFINPV